MPGMTAAASKALKLVADAFQWASENGARTPGRFVKTDTTALQMALQESDVENILWAMDQLASEGLIERKETSFPGIRLRLTQLGWQEFSKRSQEGEADRVFMALEFDAPELDPLLDNVCRPAAQHSGLSLVTARDVARAGLIDDIMRVEIRRARLVLVELTHGNRGAYWEAGFAEALGKPVVYLCRKDKWDAERTHFDTEHLHTIVWDEADLSGAQRRLAASIANSLSA